MADIKVSGFADLDPQQARKYIAKEWDERKGDQECPGGYSASMEFNQFNQMLRARFEKVKSELETLVKQEQNIPKSRISDLRQLETLCFEASCAPNTDFRRTGLRDLEKGENPRGHGTAEWSRFERIAKRMDEAEDNSPVKISVSHHEL